MVSVRDLTTDLDLSVDELHQLLALTAEIKREPQRFSRSLVGRYICLLFEKPSLRTRLTFELAIKQLGGDAVVSIGPIGDREPLKDIARNLDRWTHAIVARVFSQQTIDDLARWSQVPVINALSDLYHPCQALADMATLSERFGDLRGRKLAFVGDGNNVAHSLMLCAARLGIHCSVATPNGYEPNSQIVATATHLGVASGAKISVSNNAFSAVQDAAAVYTDVWASMGQESEALKRKRIFQPYQVNEDLMAAAGKDVVFMHCLPAHRGEEVTDGVAESDASVIFDQAEFRLHAQKALLLMMVEGA